MQTSFLQLNQQCINFDLGDYDSRQSKHSAWQTHRLSNSLLVILALLFFLISQYHLRIAMCNGLLSLSETIQSLIAVILAATMNWAERRCSR